MSNLNKVMLIGRLTRDPEVHEFPDGGKVAHAGFAVNNRRKDPASGEWRDVPVWLDLKLFNREHGRRLADLAAKLRKGRLLYVEGHLALEEWTGKDDGKARRKTLVYVDALEFIGGLPGTPGAAGEAEKGGEAADGAPDPGEADGAGEPAPAGEVFCPAPRRGRPKGKK